MGSVATEDHSVVTPRGRLFARRWVPAVRPGGHDEPIVLFHDSLGCVALWRDFPAQLARATGRTVVAYDRLGFGRSDPHPGKLDATFVRDEARGDFAALRAQLCIGGFVAFGHSVGGGMAVGCAAAFPADCRALVTESAQAFVEDRTLEGIRDAQRAFQRDDEFGRLRRHHGDKARWVLSAWTDTWLSPAFAGWSLDPELPQVACPALVIHGDRDEFGSVAHPRRIAGGVRGPATLEILAQCGHVPHREHGTRVPELVARWLDQACGGTEPATRR